MLNLNLQLIPPNIPFLANLLATLTGAMPKIIGEAGFGTLRHVSHARVDVAQQLVGHPHLNRHPTLDLSRFARKGVNTTCFITHKLIIKRQ